MARKWMLWLATLLLAVAGASAQSQYPQKTITFVAPFAAGGTNDYLTRLMAQHMGTVLRGSAVVENRTGANGLIGAGVVAKSPPDGYMLLMGNSATHGTNPTLYPDQKYYRIDDFAPVSMVGAVPIVLLVNASLKIGTIADLIAYGKANPGKLAFGSSGVGGTGHLAGEAFNAASKLNAVHVPYKGDAPAAVDAMGGQIQMTFVGVASATTPLQSGKVKAIAVFHKNRVSSMPNVPTIAEAGYKGMDFSQWYGLYARAGTPRAVIDQLNRAARFVLERDDVRAGMAGQGAEVIYTTPEGLARFSQAEIQRFGDIIRRLGVKGQ